MKIIKKVFHLYIKDTKSNHFYGTLTLLFKDNNGLGVSKATIDRWDFSIPFENDFCIINKDFIKDTTRKQKRCDCNARN